jgi:hypothetical protein
MASYDNDLPFNLNDRFADSELDMGLDKVVGEWRGTSSTREVRDAPKRRPRPRRRFIRSEELAIWSEFAYRGRTRRSA